MSSSPRNGPPQLGSSNPANHPPSGHEIERDDGRVRGNRRPFRCPHCRQLLKLVRQCRVCGPNQDDHGAGGRQPIVPHDPQPSDPAQAIRRDHQSRLSGEEGRSSTCCQAHRNEVPTP